MSDYGWYVIKHLGLFALIGVTVYILGSPIPLFGLIFVSSWKSSGDDE